MFAQSLSRVTTLLVLSASLALGQSLQTRAVIVVNIDGIRNHEAFEAGAATMPFLWDSLRPLGSIYTNLWNRGITVTNSAHSTIVTGVQQMLPNNAGIATPIRPQEPTLGEYYRKQRGIPATGVYYISGKNTIWRTPVSLTPGYGEPVAPTIALASASDTVTWDSARTILTRDHPTLAYVLFAGVDHEGHSADSARYLGAIRTVDSLIYLLWNLLQSDTVYRGTTTMFVTADHGRHDEAHGSWRGHGDYCHGCRHIPFFAVGPDIRVGESIGAFREQVDIAPTVAYLLGFDAFLARGSIMSEMFVAPPAGTGGGTGSTESERNVSESMAPSRSPSIAALPGEVFVLYAEGGPPGGTAVMRSSTDNGQTWGVRVSVFADPDVDYRETALARYADTCLFAAATGIQHISAESTYAWVLHGRRSTDRGVSWQAIQRIDTLTTISVKPCLAAAGDRINLTAMLGYRVWNYISRDGGATFVGARAHAASCTTPACALLDTTAYVAFRHLHADSLPYWNILYNRFPWLTGDHPVTANDTASYSYHPALVGGADSLVYLLYAHLANAGAGNSWSVTAQTYSSASGTWGAPMDVAPGRVGWTPAIARAPSGDLHAVWADMANDGWSIASALSTDRGATWEEAQRRTSVQEWAGSPAVVMCDDTVLIGWEDRRTGNGEIFFTAYSEFASPPVQFFTGWNMISLRVDPANHWADSLFGPSPFSYLFRYDSSGYHQVDTVDPGTGYWFKSPSAEDWSVRGRVMHADTLAVQGGWNLIGGITDSVDVADLGTEPPGIIQGEVFLFAPAGYLPTAVLLPGRGHWVKSAAPGLLFIRSAR